MRITPFSLSILTTALTLQTSSVWAADQETLSEVVVKGQSLTESRNQPFTSKKFVQEDFRERQVSQPEQLFREVPGMEVRGLGYGGVANSITLRGFSGGGHGGDIGFVIDGIPLNESSSHADGYADMNVIIPLELAGMTIFKGPVSPLYGNYNRAGVVALQSRKGGEYREFDARLGSFGTVDLQAAAGAQLGGGIYNGAVQLYRSNGFRPQSDNERVTVSGRAAYDLSPDTQIAFSARVHRAEADTASVITKAQYEQRNGFFDKDPHVQNDGTDKDFATLRADLSHSITPELKALVFVYATRQSFSRYFTRLTNATTWQQRSEDYVRDVMGYGASLNGQQALLSKPFKWVLGVEHYSEDTQFKYADALNNRNFTATTLTSGVNGGVGTLNRNLTTHTNSILAQTEWALGSLFRPTLGVRWDQISGGCQQRGIETRTGASAQCSEMPTFSVTTPKLGVRSTWVPRLLEARASVAEGFALPSDAAKFTTGLAVKPTTFRQTEIGLTLTPSSIWYLDLAHFKIDSSDEVALTSPATLTYSNIGKTRREGVEAEIHFNPVDWFEASAALAHFSSKVTETLPTSPFLIGSAVTGVPRNLATLTATVKPMTGVAVTMVSRSVGRYAITQPTATVAPYYYGGYNTLDLMMSYEPSNSAVRRQRYFVQIANLADKRYATSSGVTSGTQTYNPAPPRTFTIGASLDF
ncbi:TonB-dependent receptor [Ampullimonas aquatilis]|uniref:TonB-dependent receptor n=1 Tax=Ampullimonas aquatilis TaxID=1341549 RepID=UPI003C790B65